MGDVVAVTATGTVTLRAPGPEVAPEGTLVESSGGALRGRVVRVFGPVARPYLSVRPRRMLSVGDAAGLLGATVRETGG